MPIVILDAGHGGNDIGSYYNNRSEKDDTLRLTLRVGEILKGYNVDVEYTRVNDIYLSQFQRVEFANQTDGDLLVSIHRLSGRNLSNVPGLDFFVKMDDPIGMEAANNIGRQLADSGYHNYGIIVRTDLPLLSGTTVPAVMMGIGYMESEEESELFDRNFESIAQNIAAGILETLSEERPSEVNRVCQRCSDINQGNLNSDVNDSSKEYNYSIIIGPFHNYETALLNQSRVGSLGYTVQRMEEKHQYLLRIGAFTELDDAVQLEKMLRNYGFCTLMTRD